MIKKQHEAVLSLFKIALQGKTVLVKSLLFCLKKNFFFLLELASHHRISSKNFASSHLEGMGIQRTVVGVVVFGDLFFSA